MRDWKLIKFDLIFFVDDKRWFFVELTKNRRSVSFRCQHTAYQSVPIALWPFRGRMHPVRIQSFHLRPQVMRSRRNLDYFSTNTKLSSTKFHCQWDWSRPRKCLTWCLLLHYVPIPGDLLDGTRNAIDTTPNGTRSIHKHTHTHRRQAQQKHAEWSAFISHSVSNWLQWILISDKLIHREHNTTNRRERKSGHRSP